MRRLPVTISVVLVILAVGMTGCRAVGPKKEKEETRAEQRETIEALQSVAGSVAGEEVTEERLQELSREIEEDEETRSAVEAVREAVEGGPGEVKYCPLDGKRYSPRLEFCPDHRGVQLRWVR